MAPTLGPLEAAPSLDLLGPHGADIARLFTQPFLVLHRASAIYTARTCLLLLLDLGWEPRLRTGATLDDLCEGLPTQCRKPLAWMLPFLAGESLLAREGEAYVLRGEPDLDLAELRQIAEEAAPGHAGNFDLLDGVRSHIRPFFTEGKPGESLLFDLALYPLWLAYFRNENLGYYPNNLLTLLALREGLPEGARVLELGRSLVGRSNRNAASDLQVGLDLARAGLAGCAANVRANLSLIKDAERRSDYEQAIKDLERKGE